MEPTRVNIIPQMSHHTHPNGSPETRSSGSASGASALIAAVAAILALANPVWAAGAKHELPLVKDAFEAGAQMALAVKSGRCFVGDLRKAGNGVLFKGQSRAPLPKGHYRLHLPMALYPLGDLAVSGVRIDIDCAGALHTVNRLRFVEPDEFTDITVDFVSRGELVPVEVKWSFDELTARENRLKSVEAPEAMTTFDLSGSGETSKGDIELDDEGVTISFEDAKHKPLRLLGLGGWFQPLPPVEVTSVRTDRITYRPGDTGAVTVVVRNHSPEPVNAELQVALESGLDMVQSLGAVTFAVPADGTREWTGRFPTKDLYWGAAVRATARTAGDAVVEGMAVFGVTSNFWELAMLAPQAEDSGWALRDPANAAAHVEARREQGFTGFECFFWAPCDFGEFTPDTEFFYGGQMQYAESISGTKNLVAAAHRQGMAATFYSNLWGTDGEAGYELMRRHPEWIAGGWFNTEVLNYWWGMNAGRIPQPRQWYQTTLVTDETNSMEAVRHHASEIVGSRRMFGWDGIRYDSYYSSEWTKKATQRARELVERECPGFGFGYNSFPVEDAKVDALGVMVGGGGMCMLEYARMTTYPVLADYLDELAKNRDLVWKAGGHIGPLYAPPIISDSAQPFTTAIGIDAVHVSSIVLATGGHPYYHPLEGDVGRHQAHALRYGEFFWDNRMRNLAEPEKVVTFKGPTATNLLNWKRVAYKLNRGGDRRRVVLNLLNIPSDYTLFTNQAISTAPVIRDLEIGLKLPADTAVTGVWSLCPVPTPHHERLAEKVDKGEVAVSIPDLRFWKTVVIDYTSKEELP